MSYKNFLKSPHPQPLTPAIKNLPKNLTKPLAENEKPSTFAPAFREGTGSYKRGLARETVEWGRESEQRLFEKIMKKVLGGNGKGITFATRFRKEI